VEEGFFLDRVDVHCTWIAIRYRIEFPFVIQSVPTYSGVIHTKQTLVRAFEAPDSVCGFFIKQCFFRPFIQFTGGSRKALVSAEQSCKPIEMNQTGSAAYADAAVLDELPPGCHFAHGLSSI